MGAAVIEVITLSVSDVDRALQFYVDQVGFALDVDYAPTDAFRVAQLTPPGSGCSIQLGTGLTDAPAGSSRNAYLVVSDIEAARAGLLGRGVEVSEIRHKTPIGAWDGGFALGLDPERGDYASFADFADSDGNTWVLQERGFHNRQAAARDRYLIEGGESGLRSGAVDRSQSRMGRAGFGRTGSARTLAWEAVISSSIGRRRWSSVMPHPSGV